MPRPAVVAALATAAALALPAAAAAVSPGEVTVLSVSYLGLPTGEGRIAVGRPEGDILPVIFQARTSGLAGFLDVRENLVMYWDTDRRLTRGSDLSAIELGDYHQDVTRFDRDRGEVTVQIQRKGKVREKRASCPVDGLDLTGAFLSLRSQPLEPGQRHELPVCSDAQPFTLVAEVQGREQVKTPAGTFTALRVAVRTQLQGNFSTKRDIMLWLSDDPRHVLVRMSADFALGSIVATLKTYTPGQAVAVADAPVTAAR
jgi:hypothetical protein